MQQAAGVRGILAYLSGGDQLSVSARCRSRVPTLSELYLPGKSVWRSDLGGLGGLICDLAEITLLHCGVVHPLQDVVLHRCPPLLSVQCCPAAGSSFLFQVAPTTFCMVVLCLHGRPLSAWSSCLCMVVLSLHGRPLSAWSSCLCMVVLCLHGRPLSAWSSCLCMVVLCLHGRPLSAWSSCLCMVVLSLHGRPLSAWSSSVCMVVLSLHGRPAWSSCVCMVVLCLHGRPLSAWSSCLCMVVLSLHGRPLSAWSSCGSLPSPGWPFSATLAPFVVFHCGCMSSPLLFCLGIDSMMLVIFVPFSDP